VKRLPSYRPESPLIGKFVTKLPITSFSGNEFDIVLMEGELSFLSEVGNETTIAIALWGIEPHRSVYFPLSWR
jgi:hypothetical protein